MAKKKVAPNRGKHSAPSEAEEAALQQGAPNSARNRALPSASDAAENTAPSSSKNTASSPAKNTGPAPDKNTAPSMAKNTGPAPDKNTARALAKNTAPSSSKNPAPSSSKNLAPSSSSEDEEAVPPFKSDASANTDPALAKNTASASAKNKPPASAKNKASASAENAVAVPAASDEDEVAVPAASDEDEVAAPPLDTTLRRFIKFLCEKATSMWWQGLLDAFLTWMYGSTGNDTSDASRVSHTDGVESSEEEEIVVEDAPSGGSIHEAEAPIEGSAHQEQREKRKEQKNQRHLEETKNTQQKASPQLPEERRCQNHAYMYAKDACHRNGRDLDETKADGSVPADPSISKIIEDEDPYQNERRYEEFCEARMKLSVKRELCTICFFEESWRRADPSVKYGNMITHFQRLHHILGVKCGKNFCDIRFRSCEHQRLYTFFCTRIWETNAELRCGRFCRGQE